MAGGRMVRLGTGGGAHKVAKQTLQIKTLISWALQILNYSAKDKEII
jgi:hypothetical protein